MKQLTKTGLMMILLWLLACTSKGDVSFQNSLSYHFNFDIDKVERDSIFTQVTGKNREKILFTEDMLDNTLSKINPPIGSTQFFDGVYSDTDDGLDAEVLFFKHAYIQGKVAHKYRKVKSNSIIYLWEFENKNIRGIDLAKNSTYFLRIKAEHTPKDPFLTD